MDADIGLKDGPLCVGKDFDSSVAFHNETSSLDTIEQHA